MDKNSSHHLQLKKKSISDQGLHVRLLTVNDQEITATQNNEEFQAFHLEDRITLFNEDQEYVPSSQISFSPEILIQDVNCYADEEYQRGGLQRKWLGDDIHKVYKSPIFIYEILPYGAYKELYSNEITCRFEVVLPNQKKQYTFTEQGIHNFSSPVHLTLKDYNQEISSESLIEFTKSGDIFLIDPILTKEDMVYKVFCERQEMFYEIKPKDTRLPIHILRGFLLNDEKIQGVKRCRILLETSSSKEVKAMSVVFSMDFDS